jgi:hypothetical protein
LALRLLSKIASFDAIIDLGALAFTNDPVRPPWEADTMQEKKKEKERKKKDERLPISYDMSAKFAFKGKTVITPGGYKLFL